jgi:hypothetical protein
VAGVAGLWVTETDAGRRKRAESRTTKRSKGSDAVIAQKGSSAGTAQTVTIREGCPKKPAESIAILSAYYPGYWWDHTDLTVAVQFHPNADPALIAAVREAIVIWNDVLAAAGALSIVTLTDVTDSGDPEHKADIVLHYVPDAGGTVFGGYAICGDHKCNNVLVRSDLPKPLDRDPYTAEYLGWVTLHELGHALGLGHAEPLEETNDLMGYGWPPLEPVLSPCDLRALEVVFAWAIAGDDPYPPTVASVDCSDLCKQRR